MGSYRRDSSFSRRSGTTGDTGHGEKVIHCQEYWGRGRPCWRRNRRGLLLSLMLRRASAISLALASCWYLKWSKPQTPHIPPSPTTLPHFTHLLPNSVFIMIPSSGFYYNSRFLFSACIIHPLSKKVNSFYK